ncbi:TPA: transcription elongation factor TFIIS, variant 2 [Trebouxia sp. C0004]
MDGDGDETNTPGYNKRRKIEQQTAAEQQPSGQTEIKTESLDQLKASLPKLDDAMRHKTALLMLEGLHKALQEGVEGDAVQTAADIEQAIFQQYGGVNANYKTKVRSLAFNMKDARNPDLRARVLDGEISGYVLVTLTSDELASNERRKENKEIRQHALREANPAGIKKATTDAFQCGKCKQKKCVYYQMQTRSADEPMTTFVTCTVCDHRWKFRWDLNAQQQCGSEAFNKRMLSVSTARDTSNGVQGVLL